MLDRALRPLIAPLLDSISRPLAQNGVRANQVTWFGFAIGVVAAFAIASENYLTGLAALLLNRLADGLDGCLARSHGATDLGGYLDIVLDFIVYSGMAFAFAVAQPDAALSAGFLIFSFVGTGTSFLAFAIFAAKRSLIADAKDNRGFYFLGGLTEGAETILFFAIICLAPTYFSAAAYAFGGLCWLTTIGRIATAINILRD